MAAHERQPLLNEKVDCERSQSGYNISQNKRRIERWREDVPSSNQPRSRAWWIAIAALTVSIIAGAYTVHTICRVGAFYLHPSHAYGDPQKPIKDPRPASNYSCIPGQACWPSREEWSVFNQSIDGRLRLTIPWAAPCYGNLSIEKCKDVGEDYMNGVERTQQYGAMEFLDWETCGQSSCFLNSFKPSSPLSGECSLGRLSTYHVKAHTADDISKTLNFVREHGIRVSIKNTGHDYFGRSNAANSLAIWTHNLKEIQYHRTFETDGCNARYENVGEIGAGVQAQEAWEFFEPLDMMVTVGAVSSVGIAGGYGQGGGHGPLGPKYGLMVDQAIEFDVVTADGQPRTINECNDPELFWAMRGGGGGTYAVLTSYKFQLHPAVPINVYSIMANFTIPDANLDISESKLHRDIIRELARNQAVFAENGIAGYNFILPDHMVSLQVLPSSNTSAIEAVTTQWHEFITTYPGLNISENEYFTFEKFSEWHEFTEKPRIAQNGPVGVGISESGRFLPKKLFENEKDIESVVEAVVTAMQYSLSHGTHGAAQLYSTGPHNHADNSKTGLNPAFRTAMWEVIMGGIWTSNTPPVVRTTIRDTISNSIEPFKKLTPGGGCYMNEGDWTEVDWQRTFFGDNYEKLLGVKQNYDPTGLFNCWKCVGWTGYEDPMYSCYSQSRKTPNPTVPLGPVG